MPVKRPKFHIQRKCSDISKSGIIGHQGISVIHFHYFNNMAKNNRYMSGEELLKKATQEEDDDTEENDEQESEEENYEMPKDEAITEHERLIKVLKSGDKTLQMAEAKIQEKELKKIRK